jgi:hypothetical protein
VTAKGYTRSDERIREDVCDMLAGSPMVDASESEVQVKGGDVTLTGSVNSREEKRLAEDLIENISGVKEVNNQLRVQRQQQHEGMGLGSSSTMGSQSTMGQTSSGENGRTTSTQQPKRI